MYTEDDEEVKVKNKNSNNDYNDFYTSFNESNEKKEKKNDKKKTKKEVAVTPKNEEDFSDFYGTGDEMVEEPPVSYSDNNSKGILKIVIIIILLVVIGLLVYFLLGRNKESGDIEINNSNITLETGESEYISYRIINTEKDVTSTFTSSNPSVATVDENGEIKAVSKGEATITIHYTIDGKTKEKECIVKVNGPDIPHEITLDLKSSATNWTNKDVTITTDAKSDSEITSIKYAINCSSNCDYKDVQDKKIVISNNGVTKVTVIAKDKNNQEIKKEIEVKIDKEAPTVTYSGSNNITSDKDVEVCVTCSDNISGCKQNKVCKKFTSTKTNQVITVSDNAGNSVNSPSFNVTINRAKVTCSLKVSSDGTVSATLGSTAAYYGFNSSYTGSNELSKKIDVTIPNGVGEAAKVVHYYVKDKNGNVGSCHITIIKSCSSIDNCTFR